MAKKQTFEQSISRLEEIVTALEKGDGIVIPFWED